MGAGRVGRHQTPSLPEDALKDELVDDTRWRKSRQSRDEFIGLGDWRGSALHLQVEGQVGWQRSTARLSAVVRQLQRFSKQVGLGV